MKSSRTPFKIIRGQTPGPGAYSPKEPQKHVPAALIIGRQTPDPKKAVARSAGAACYTPTSITHHTTTNSAKPVVRNRSSPTTNEFDQSKRSSILQKAVCLGCSKKLEKLESELQSLGNTKSVLEKVIEEKTSELLAVGTAIGELRHGNMLLARANDDILNRLNETTKHCHDLELHLQEELANRATISAKLNESERFIDQLRAEKEHLAKQLNVTADSRSEVDRLLMTISEKDRLLQQLRVDLDRVNSERKADMERLAAQQREQERLVEDQRAEIERLREEVRSANESVCVCAAEFEQAVATADALRNELNENAKMIAFYRNAAEEREAELVAARSQLEKTASSGLSHYEKIDEELKDVAETQQDAQDVICLSDAEKMNEMVNQNAALQREVANQRSAMLALQTANTELLRRANERDAAMAELESRVHCSRKRERRFDGAARSDVESAIGSQRSVTESEFSSTTDHRDDSSADTFAEHDTRRSVEAETDQTTYAFATNVADKDLFSFSTDIGMVDTQLTMNATCEPSRANATDCTALLIERVETNQRLEHLVRKYAALLDDFAALRDERETSRALSETYHADCMRFRSQLDSALSRIAELQANFNRQAEQLEAANTALQAGEDARIELERRLMTANAEVQRHRSELESERQRCQSEFQKELARCRAEYDAELARCRNACESKMTACVRKMEAQSAEMYEQLDRAGDLIEQLSDAQAEIDELEALNEGLAAANSSLTRELDTVKRQLSGRSSPPKPDNDVMKAKVAELERLVSEASAERVSLTAVIAKKDGELSSLVALSTKLGHELQSLKSANAELNVKLDASRNELMSMRDERSRLRHACHEMRAQIAPFKDVLNAYDMERRALTERTNGSANSSANANTSSPRITSFSRKVSDDKLNEDTRKLTQRYTKLLSNEKHRQRFQNVVAITSRQAGLEQENERLRNEIANMKLRDRDSTVQSPNSSETVI